MGTPRRHLPKNACVRLRSDLLNKKTPEILPFDVAQNSQYFRSFFICKSSCSSENKHFWADAFVAVYERISLRYIVGSPYYLLLITDY